MVLTKKPGSARSQSSKCLDHLKAAGRRTIPQRTLILNSSMIKNLPRRKHFWTKISRNQIRHLCSDLKSPYREVATAHFCEEKTAAEIAKAQNKKYQNSPDADLPCKIHAEGTAGKGAIRCIYHRMNYRNFKAELWILKK